MSVPSSNVIAAVAAGLRKRYGSPRPVKRPMLDVLIETVLSQNTSDANSHRAFRELRQAFPRWEQVSSAPWQRIAAAIRSGGLANIKAGRIRELLGAFKERNRKWSLAFLTHMEPERAYHCLLSLNGVGPKTAACTLLFGAGIPVFPVDTHIFRISKRLGWANANESPERYQERIRHRIPAAMVYSLHINMISHGRKVCHPRDPACQDCCVNKHCEWYHERIGS